MPMDVYNLNWMMMADEFSRWNAFRKKNRSMEKNSVLMIGENGETDHQDFG